MSTPNKRSYLSPAAVVVLVIFMVVVIAIGFLVGIKSVEPVVQEKIVVEKVEVAPQACLDFVDSSGRMMGHAGDAMQLAAKAIRYMEDGNDLELERVVVQMDEINELIESEREVYQTTRQECQSK